MSFTKCPSLVTFKQKLKLRGFVTFVAMDTYRQDNGEEFVIFHDNPGDKTCARKCWEDGPRRGMTCGQYTTLLFQSHPADPAAPYCEDCLLRWCSKTNAKKIK